MGEGPKDVRNDAGTDPRTRGEDFTSRSTSDLTGRPVENVERAAGTESVVGYAGTPGPFPSASERVDTRNGSDRDTSEIRSEIEQTRNNISETVDAIQQRLSPGNLVSEARDTVKQRTRERAQQVAERAQQYAESAGEMAAQVSDRAQQVAGRVANTTRRVSSRAVTTARENPWTAVAAVAGVSAAAWFLLGRRREYDDFDDDDLDEFTEESLYYDEFDVDDEERRPWTAAIPGGAVPLVIAGAGVGYWLWSRQGRRRSLESGYTTEDFDSWSDDGGFGADAGSYRSFDEGSESWTEQASDAASSAADRARAAVRSATDRARGAVSSASGRARNAVSSATDRAREAMSTARGRARGAVGDVTNRSRVLADRASRQIGDAGRTAQSQLEHWMERNPLAVGAAALAIGAIVGLALPVSERERAMIGPARDRVMDRAQQLASNAVDRAKQTARETVQQVADKATAAMNEAGNQGQPG